MNYESGTQHPQPVEFAPKAGIVGVIIGAVIAVALIYIGSMLLYFHARRRFAHCKWIVEVSFIGFAVLATCGFNIALLCIADKYGMSFGTAIANTFHGLFNGVGNLTFNGIESDIPELSRGFICCYYGAALYTALMFFGILSAKANYEFFSRIILLLPEWHKDIYVFTALNNETLMLARSVAAKSVAEQGPNKRRKPFVVVFAIPYQTPFDRHNELCREVMSNGFYYWSYSADAEKRKFFLTRVWYYLLHKKDRDAYSPTRKVSIAKMLHLNNRNTEDKTKKFYIFAFDSEDNIPKEEQNMATVFNDIICRGGAENNDRLRINYFILTKRQVKYTAYDYKMRELKYNYYCQLREQAKRTPADIEEYLLTTCDSSIREYKLSTGEKATFTVKQFLALRKEDFKAYIFASKLELKAFRAATDKNTLETALKWLDNTFNRRFLVEIWDEASVIAKSIIDKSTEGLCRVFNRTDKDVNVLSLGFGETGTAAAMALYSHAAYIDDDYRTNQCSVHVYDLVAENIAHCFATERPYSCVSQVKPDWVSEDNPRGERAIRTKAQVDAVIRRLNPHISLGALDNEMAYPQLYFHAEDCRRLTFLECLDEGVPPEKPVPPTMPRPEFIVVATGDDFANVRMTNAIIQRVVNNSLYRRQARIDVFVNVWDKENNDLVVSGGGLWDDAHKTLTVKQPPEYRRTADDDMLVVHVVGNNIDIYSAHSTIDIARAAAFNAQYERITKYGFDARLTATYPSWQEKGMKDGKEIVLEPFGEEFNTAFSRALSRIHLPKEEDTPEKASPEAEDTPREEEAAFAPQNRREEGGEPLPTPLQFKQMVYWIDYHTALLDAKPTEAEAFAQQLDYYALDMWRKESNAMVCHNIELYRRILQSKGLTRELIGAEERKALVALDKNTASETVKKSLAEVTDSEKQEACKVSEEELERYVQIVRKYSLLSHMEHQRWNRLHIAYGWVYNGQTKKNELVCQHNCIVPYSSTPLSTILYDLANVLMAWEE